MPPPQGMPENPRAAISLWSSATDTCPRPSCCSRGRCTVALPTRVCRGRPCVTRRTAPRKTRLMPCPALRAMSRSPWPTRNAFLATRSVRRGLVVLILGGGGSGALTSAPAAPSNAVPPEDDHRTGGCGNAPRSRTSVDDVDTDEGVGGGGGLARISLIEVLPWVLSSPFSCRIRRFPTIRCSSCLSVGLAAGSCTER